jgi:flagellar basal-body rod protein FlgB
MIESLFQSTTIPVLEQVVGFTQARHGVLAGNVANLDTPGYKTRDLSPALFEEKLREAVEKRREPVPRNSLPQSYGYDSTQVRKSQRSSMDDFRDVQASLKSILYHDESDVAIEKQVTEMAKNQSRHNLALSLMISQFQLLEAAISERA